MSQATLFPLSPELQINFHSPGSHSCQAVSSWPAMEHCLTDTPAWKTMAVISERLINISGIAEKGKNSEKMASCYPSWPGFQESWVSTVDITKSSSGAAGAGQLWAAEAAPLLLQCMSEIQRNGVKIHLTGTSSYLNNPIYCPLAMVLCHVSQTNYLHNPEKIRPLVLRIPSSHNTLYYVWNLELSKVTLKHPAVRCIFWVFLFLLENLQKRTMPCLKHRA